MKLFTCGTTALFAAALTLQAQTSGTSAGSAAGSSATSNTGASSQAMPSSSPQSSSQFGTSSATPSTSTSATAPQSSGSQFGSSSTNATSSTQTGTAPANPNTPTGANSGFSTSTPSTYGSQSFNAAGSANTSANINSSANMNSTTNSTTQSATVAAGGFTTVSDGQVTTFVQQFDNVGPDVVVQRVSSDLGDLACSQDTVQNLVQALHNGQSVTITSNVNGQPQSATFNPQGVHMGYGEAYLTLAMAAQELRNAGVTTCATPEQWNAVLMGGPLNVTSTSTTYNSSASASGSRQVQGIVTLRQQGQGWGQIAQSNNVQLGQVINSGATSQTGAQSGFSNSQAEQGNVNASGTVEDNGSHKSHKKHWWSRDKDKDNNKDSSSTHADDSAKPDNK